MSVGVSYIIFFILFVIFFYISFFLYLRLKKYRKMIVDLSKVVDNYKIATDNYKKAIERYTDTIDYYTAILKDIEENDIHKKEYEILDEIHNTSNLDLDNILDKLSKNGIKSLSKEEVQFLKSKSKTK